MDVTSLAFAAFVMLLLWAAYRVPGKWRNGLLLVASYGFYASWSWEFPLLLAVVTTANWLLGRAMGRNRSRAIGWLWIGIAANLLLLLWFRMRDFFLPELLPWLARLGIDTDHGVIGLLLPIGLSFYVLQVIAYLIEVARGRLRPGGLLDFALYLAWFPKLTAGPIERPARFFDELARPRSFDAGQFARGLALIVIGLVRKLVVADTLFAAFPERVLTDPAGYTAAVLAGWLLLYVLAVYNDFAGYSDIARGISRLFGIELSRNFALPLLARNWGELWSRWHISLSSWLRDYIYFPVSRALLKRNPSRSNLANLVLPPMLTMVASGLWHGGTWNLLLWGALLGAYQVVERLFTLGRAVRPVGDRPLWHRAWRQVSQRLLMAGSIVLATALFAMDVPTALAAWGRLVEPAGWIGAPDPGLRVALILLPALWIDWLQHRSGDELVFLAWPRPVRALLVALAALGVLLFTIGQLGKPFIYQGF